MPMKILNATDIQPVPLSKHIDQLLHQQRTADALSVDFQGAANAASFLNRWVNESLR